jgi:hypothetical protein
MTADDFRRLALSFPDTRESSHMRHPDVRVYGRIFATLGYPNENWGMVKLPPDEQQTLSRLSLKSSGQLRARGARQGSTGVRLEAADASTLNQALGMAWRYASAKLVRNSKKIR